jgi:DNA-binding NtrC family response regulator
LDEVGLRGLMDVIRPIGASDATVLILGERGVEHDRVARLIHALSPRGAGRFGAVNCAALSAPGLDRELFGTEGRTRGGGRPGKIRQTSGGTLFLDEVSEMPLSIQGRLLQFLQEQRVLRPALGHDVPVDIRLVAASHRDLRTMVAQQGFRGDLYYRLNVLRIYVPPLRERRAELADLVPYFHDKYGQRHGRRSRPISPPAMEALLTHSWPGNVGELENVLERIVVLGTDDWVPAELAAARVDAARRASLKPVSGASAPRATA